MRFGFNAAMGLLFACLLVVGCTQQINAAATANKAGEGQAGPSQLKPLPGPGTKSSCSSPLLHPQFSELKKINHQLLCAEALASSRGTSFAAVAADMGIDTTQKGVALDIVMNRLDDDIRQRLQMPGLSIRYLSMRYKRISAVIKNSAILYQLARMPEVRVVMPEYGTRTRTGSTSEGK